MEPTEGASNVRAGMMRHPCVSERYIAFVYSDNIWTVGKAGGLAQQLTDLPGLESFPRFSPCGRYLAFSATYGGSQDVYVAEVEGSSQPRRLTCHPSPDRMLDWCPEGKALLFASSRESARSSYSQLYRVELEGDPLRESGPPRKLGLPYAEFAAISPDRRFLAFQFTSTHTHHWEGYRGGKAPDLFLYDLSGDSERRRIQPLFRSKASDSNPQWRSLDRLLFLSDWWRRGETERRFNLWQVTISKDGTAGDRKPLTSFEAFDVRYPCVGGGRDGPRELVFEMGGDLYHVSLEREPDWSEIPPLEIEVPRSALDLKKRKEKIGFSVNHYDIHPRGQQAVLAARGDLFLAASPGGEVKQLTRSSHSHERLPSISPTTGRWLAYHSDAVEEGQDKEYSLVLHDLENNENQRIDLGTGFRYSLAWSPDESKLTFIDHEMRIWVARLPGDEGERIQVRELTRVRGFTSRSVEDFISSWSPDSRWLAFSRPVENRNHAIFLADTRELFADNESDPAIYQVTSGDYNDRSPCFDVRAPLSLFFVTRRSFNVLIGEIGYGWIYANSEKIAQLRIPEEALTGKSSGDPGQHVEVFEEIERDTRELPIPPGKFERLQSIPAGLLYHRRPNKGSQDSRWPVLLYERVWKRPTVIVESADSFVATGDGARLLVESRGELSVIDLTGSEAEQPLLAQELVTEIDPVAEREQIFDEALRLIRDFLYFGRAEKKSREDAQKESPEDANKKRLDAKKKWLEEWRVLRGRHRPRLRSLAGRRDLNRLLLDVGAELGRSHFKASRGDLPLRPSSSRVGLLGADVEVRAGVFQVVRILDAGRSESVHRSPLRIPVRGRPVKEGSLILEIDREPVDTGREIWWPLRERQGREVELTLDESPLGGEPGRRVKIRALSIGQERRLRLGDWIETNRRWVDRVTGGKVGYVAIPNTLSSGRAICLRQFQAQYETWGLIFDSRFNAGGGLYPDSLIELIGRPRTALYVTATASLGARSFLSRSGPQVMLINAWAQSGGDLLPYLFRSAGLGKLVGTRTWGGVIAGGGVPRLVDGGLVGVPNLAFLEGPDSLEGKGVEPSVEVEEDLEQLMAGRDDQLEAAVAEILWTKRRRRGAAKKRLERICKLGELTCREGSGVDTELADARRRILNLLWKKAGSRRRGDARLTVAIDEVLERCYQPSSSKNGKTASSGRSRSAARMARASSPLKRLWR